MANIIPLKDSAGAQFYPQTHEKAVVDSNGVTLDTKLDAIVNRKFKEAWDGSSTPVVAEIPAGVVVTYNSQSYTGTLAASAATASFIYMVADGNGNYDRYVSELSGSSYVWKYYGNTEIDLSDYTPIDDFNQLDQEVGEKEETTETVILAPGTWADGKSIIAVSGNNYGLETNSTSNSHSDYVDVSEFAGKTITYTRQGTTTASPTYGLAFYDGTKTPVPGGETALPNQAVESLVSTVIAVPSSAKYARFTVRTINTSSFSAIGTKTTSTYISGLGKRVQDLEADNAAINSELNEIRVKREYNSDSLRTGYFRLAGLVVGSDFIEDFRTSSTKYSQRFPLKAGDKLTLKTHTTATTTGALGPYCVVDMATKKVLAINVDNPADTIASPFEYTAPSDCFVYVCCNQDNLAEFSLTVLPAKERKVVNICVIGNSYSLDSFMYLPFILANYGIDVKVGIYYRSEGTLANHVSEFTNGGNPFYYIDTTRQFRWGLIGNQSPEACVKYANWDIVVIQQGGVASVDASTFEPAARNLINLICGAQSPVKIGWNININRKSSGESAIVEPEILENISNTVDGEPVTIVFPYGTAIFNARTNEVLDAIGDGGDLWASDEIHLQEGIPCYIAALANAERLMEEFYPDVSVLGDYTVPDATSVSLWNVQGTQGTPAGVTDANRRLAQVCAIVANRYPFSIKTIA